MFAPKTLLIDGYNVIHKIPELKSGLASGGLENARRQLALLVSRWSHICPGTRCTIVFDGDQQFSGGRSQQLAGIPCVFTQKRHGADAEIIRLVREHPGAKSDITVVSDDNSVRNSCRAHGATVQPAGFIRSVQTVKAGSSPSPAKSKSRVNGKSIDRKAAADIDKEMRKVFKVE